MGLETLRGRRCCRKICLFYKVLENENPRYLFISILNRCSLYPTRNILNMAFLDTKQNLSKTLFVHRPWLNGTTSVLIFRKFESFSVFESNILNFIWPFPYSLYICLNSRGIYLITRIRLGLREHKFKHDFQGTLNPLCSWGNDREFT